MSSEIRDINLAESGEQKIEWVKRNCDLLRMLEEADENVRAGCIAPMENTFSALRDSLLQRKQQ